MTFSIAFNRKLNAVITPDNQQQILHFIEKSIIEDKADNVIVGETYVKYKGSTSMWNTSLFRGVDGGTFTLVYKNDTSWLEYNIKLYRLFISAIILSVILCVFVLTAGIPWWTALIPIFWLLGMNLITIYLRHGTEATEIAEGIDQLICGKPERHETDKIPGKLKSWY